MTRSRPLAVQQHCTVAHRVRRLGSALEQPQQEEGEIEPQRSAPTLASR